jgi:hypothetical protein
MTAGEELRASINAALARASQEAGAELAWSETEQVALDSACHAADRAAALRTLLGDELAGERRPSVAAKGAAELRQQERHVTDMLARLSFGTEPAKSSRHQRAANARWGRRDAAWGAARSGGA